MGRGTSRRLVEGHPSLTMRHNHANYALKIHQDVARRYTHNAKAKVFQVSLPKLVDV